MFDELGRADLSALPFNPAAEAPALTTTLMPHQRDGVAWLLSRERGGTGRLPPFWEQRVENKATIFINAITCSSQPMPPPAVRGGILADDVRCPPCLLVWYGYVIAAVHATGRALSHRIAFVPAACCRWGLARPCRPLLSFWPIPGLAPSTSVVRQRRRSLQ